MSFGKTPRMPPVEKPPPPPNPPSQADVSTSGTNIPETGAMAARSLINTGGQGLATKAKTAKRSLIGGA